MEHLVSKSWIVREQLWPENGSIPAAHVIRSSGLHSVHSFMGDDVEYTGTGEIVVNPEAVGGPANLKAGSGMVKYMHWIMRCVTVSLDKLADYKERLVADAKVQRYRRLRLDFCVSGDGCVQKLTLCVHELINSRSERPISLVGDATTIDSRFKCPTTLFDASYGTANLGPC
jgi:hypothetical protein